MAIKVTKPKRVFRYNGIDHPDPAPDLSVERAIELLSTTHAALTNAVADPAQPEDGVLIYNLKAAVGTKG